MEIGEGCLNEWNGDWAIEDYPNLDKIIVKKNSLMNLNSLKICKCELLKSIEIKENSLKCVNNVKIESIFEITI